jgi:hypothetical protein
VEHENAYVDQKFIKIFLKIHKVMISNAFKDFKHKEDQGAIKFTGMILTEAYVRVMERINKNLNMIGQ